MSFPKYVYMTKNTPFFQILHVFASLNAVRAYSAWSWKTTLITWILGWAWYPPWHLSGPPRGFCQPQTFKSKGLLQTVATPTQSEIFARQFHLLSDYVKIWQCGTLWSTHQLTWQRPLLPAFSHSFGEKVKRRWCSVVFISRKP